MEERRIVNRLIKLIIILLIILGISVALTNNKVDIQPTKTKQVVNLNNIPKPTQQKVSGKVTKEVSGYKVTINYVAKYSISGRVVDVQNYAGNDIGNQLSPRDVGMSWGFLAIEKNHNKLKWSSMGNRYLSWYVDDMEWVKEVGGTHKINSCSSNNHLIPNNQETRKLINKIKKNDFIKIDGYLVNVQAKNDKGSTFYWNSSTTRNDSGDGACEVIYVTNVTWLKNSK